MLPLKPPQPISGKAGKAVKVVAVMAGHLLRKHELLEIIRDSIENQRPKWSVNNFLPIFDGINS